jgi:hypothetical protein
VVVVASGVAPDLVEPRHREHPAVLGPDEERLLARLARLGLLLGGVPLEVAVGGQQAATAGERPLEGGLLGHGLHPGVDHPVADRRILGPGRHQPPPHDPQLALWVLLGLAGGAPLHDGVDLLGGRDVVVGLERLLDPVVDHVELLDEVFGLPARCVATAHGSTLGAMCRAGRSCRKEP